MEFGTAIPLVLLLLKPRPRFFRESLRQRYLSLGAFPRIFPSGILMLVFGMAWPSVSVFAGEPRGMRAEKKLVVIRADRDPELDRMFRNCSPWIGGDAADSVALGGGRILWLFGDSYLGSEEGARRKIVTMIRNALAIQEGTAPERPRLRFFTGDSLRQPRAFFRPDKKEWVWPCRGGLRTAAGLYVFLPRFRLVTRRPDGFGFEMDGMILAKISNPNDSPGRWKIRFFCIPWSMHDTQGRGRSFGNPLRGPDGLIYCPGIEDVPGDRHLLMARTASESLEDFGAWEFYKAGRWTHRPQDAARLCNHVGAEFSLSWKPALKSYLLVTTENGLSDRIVARTAPRPWGPWNNAVTLYRAPEPARDRSLFCYAGKEHPELARRGDEIVLSYVCNADTRKIELNPTLYRPEFVRVRLRRPLLFGTKLAL